VVAILALVTTTLVESQVSDVQLASGPHQISIPQQICYDGAYYIICSSLHSLIA